MENWVHFVKSKRNYSEPTRQSEVCGEHFTNKNYTNRFAHLTDNSFNRLEERWFIEEENRSRSRHNVERFLCAHYISAGQTSLLLVPEEGWFGQPKYRATVVAFRIFPFLDNEATVGCLVRELPQYIAATQDVVIECEEKKVEWWRVHE